MEGKKQKTFDVRFVNAVHEIAEYAVTSQKPFIAFEIINTTHKMQAALLRDFSLLQQYYELYEDGEPAHYGYE